jgi:hypothetical protein
VTGLVLLLLGGVFVLLSLVEWSVPALVIGLLTIVAGFVVLAVGVPVIDPEEEL